MSRMSRGIPRTWNLTHARLNRTCRVPCVTHQGRCDVIRLLRHRVGDHTRRCVSSLMCGIPLHSTPPLPSPPHLCQRSRISASTSPTTPLLAVCSGAINRGRMLKPHCHARHAVHCMRLGTCGLEGCGYRWAMVRVECEGLWVGLRMRNGMGRLQPMASPTAQYLHDLHAIATHSSGPGAPTSPPDVGLASATAPPLRLALASAVATLAGVALLPHTSHPCAGVARTEL